MGWTESETITADVDTEYTGTGLDGYLTVAMPWVNPASTKQGQGFKIETVWLTASTFRYGGGGIAFFPQTTVKDASSGTTTEWIIGYNGEHTSQMSQIMTAVG